MVVGARLLGVARLMRLLLPALAIVAASNSLGPACVAPGFSMHSFQDWRLLIRVVVGGVRESRGSGSGGDAGDSAVFGRAPSDAARALQGRGATWRGATCSRPNSAARPDACRSTPARRPPRASPSLLDQGSKPRRRAFPGRFVSALAACVCAGRRCWRCWRCWRWHKYQV